MRILFLSKRSVTIGFRKCSLKLESSELVPLRKIVDQAIQEWRDKFSSIKKDKSIDKVMELEIKQIKDRLQEQQYISITVKKEVLAHLFGSLENEQERADWLRMQLDEATSYNQSEHKRIEDLEKELEIRQRELDKAKPVSLYKEKRMDMDEDKEKMVFQKIQCPFCEERDFDLIGLKLHLMNGHCKKYESIIIRNRLHFGFSEDEV